MAVVPDDSFGYDPETDDPFDQPDPDPDPPDLLPDGHPTEPPDEYWDWRAGVSAFLDGHESGVAR